MGDTGTGRHKPGDSLCVVTTLSGRAPVAVAGGGQLLVCAGAGAGDCSILVHTHSAARGWSLAATLAHHTDQVRGVVVVVVVVTRCVQVTGLALSGDCTLLASCSWDGTVAVWSLGPALSSLPSHQIRCAQLQLCCGLR